MTLLSVIAAACRRARSASARKSSASVDMVLGMVSVIRTIALRFGQRGENNRLVVIG